MGKRKYSDFGEPLKCLFENCNVYFQRTTINKQKVFCSNLCNLSSRKGKTGHSHSEETKYKMSLSHKGKIKSKEHLENISKALTKNPKLEIISNKKLNISNAQKKRFETEIIWNKGKEHLAVKGDKNPNWKGGISSNDKLERAKFRRILQKLVFKRDNYTCQKCYKYGGYLQVNHIKTWADYPHLRFDIDNCQTLCMACHYFETFNKEIPNNIIWGHNFNKYIQSVKDWEVTL